MSYYDDKFLAPPEYLDDDDYECDACDCCSAEDPEEGCECSCHEAPDVDGDDNDYDYDGPELDYLNV